MTRLYDAMLPRQYLRLLVADDPAVGTTIMAGHARRGAHPRPAMSPSGPGGIAAQSQGRSTGGSTPSTS